MNLGYVQSFQLLFQSLGEKYIDDLICKVDSGFISSNMVVKKKVFHLSLHVDQNLKSNEPLNTKKT